MPKSVLGYFKTKKDKLLVRNKVSIQSLLRLDNCLGFKSYLGSSNLRATKHEHLLMEISCEGDFPEISTKAIAAKTSLRMAPTTPRQV